MRLQRYRELTDKVTLVVWNVDKAGTRRDLRLVFMWTECSDPAVLCQVQIRSWNQLVGLESILQKFSGSHSAHDVGDINLLSVDDVALIVHLAKSLVFLTTEPVALFEYLSVFIMDLVKESCFNRSTSHCTPTFSTLSLELASFSQFISEVLALRKVIVVSTCSVQKLSDKVVLKAVPRDQVRQSKQDQIQDDEQAAKVARQSNEVSEPLIRFRLIALIDQDLLHTGVL